MPHLQQSWTQAAAVAVAGVAWLLSDEPPGPVQAGAHPDSGWGILDPAHDWRKGAGRSERSAVPRLLCSRFGCDQTSDMKAASRQHREASQLLDTP